MKRTKSKAASLPLRIHTDIRNSIRQCRKALARFSRMAERLEPLHALVVFLELRAFAEKMKTHEQNVVGPIDKKKPNP